MTFFHIKDIFEHASQPYSEKHRYSDPNTDNAISHNTLSLVTQYHIIHFP